MKILPVSEWHEDLCSSIFIKFSRNEDGEIMGESPEVCYASGYLDPDFDMDYWDYFVDGNINTWFEQAKRLGDKWGF
jgi:hypothetical protein